MMITEKSMMRGCYSSSFWCESLLVNFHFDQGPFDINTVRRLEVLQQA